MEIADRERALSAVDAQLAEALRSFEFTMNDLVQNNLIMGSGAKERRIAVGEALGIGYTNAKQFLSRLNH